MGGSIIVRIVAAWTTGNSLIDESLLLVTVGARAETPQPGHYNRLIGLARESELARRAAPAAGGAAPRRAGSRCPSTFPPEIHGIFCAKRGGKG